MSNETFIKARAPLSLQQFALRIAAPREFIIAGIINGVIAYLLYADSQSVRLIGGHSLMSMLLPMSLLLPGLSSFFGVLAASLGRKAGAIDPPLAADVRWTNYAVRMGIRRALLWFMVMVFLYGVFRFKAWNIEISGIAAFFSITFGSATAAALFHATAILSSKTIQ